MYLIKKLPAIILPAFLLCLTANSYPTNKIITTNTTKINMTDTTANVALPAASAFERTIDGKQTHLYTMKNKKGMQVAVTNYGAHLVAALVPDKKGKLVSVVLGFDDMEGFQKTAGSYYGAIVGRYGNRIAKGKFTL